MPSATASLLTATLAQARTDWLAGDPSAWSRYADCLARLEAHVQPKPEHTLPPPPHSSRRAPRGLA